MPLHFIVRDLYGIEICFKKFQIIVAQLQIFDVFFLKFCQTIFGS